MGSSESKRKIVVEDVTGEGVVQVTEAVVRRIKGLPELPEQESANNSTKEASNGMEYRHRHQTSADNENYRSMKKEIEEFYNEKLNDLQKRSEDLQQHSNDQFATAVKEVEQKFLKYTSSPVCQDLQTKVLECYQSKPDSILDCSPVVNAFSTCVDRARMTVSQSRPQNLQQVVEPVS